ncbi:FkbM family methyltransferase [Sphingopyxis sp.]|jgi:FkbM family methyltransferase|uniref:FkbM family methyltransferase n=1 Tax=Sphingopyxis sp. TaxID=1908224 RepID=UPI0025E824F0|nr:FkbM family methyltransferase [Sphingopyxis sp.]MBK6413858.1 FkbM family methyltransferase [Sphingopyxis sp.]
MSAAAPSPLASFFVYGVKKTLHKAWVHLLTALPLARSDPVVTSRYGVRMRANWRDRTFQYCRYATYGRALSDYIAVQDRPFTFVDIGANQGLYSLLAARNRHCVSAVAFEPVAATFALLRDNIALNGAGTKIRPVHAAVSLQSGMARIATDDAHSGIASLRGTATSGGEEIRILGISGVDTLLEGATPLIVKIDVEGHEEAVAQALMASAHRDRIAAIFYEVDARWTDATKIEAQLRPAGFVRFTRYGIGGHYDVLASR